MNDSYFVGVDPSLSNTGCVILSEAGQVVNARNTAITLKEWAAEGRKMEASARAAPLHQMRRLQQISNCLQGFIHTNVPQDAVVFIAYEDYSYHSVNRPFALGELGGVLKKALLFSLYRKVDSLTLVAPTLLKQFAVGVGSAEKEEVMAQAQTESAFIQELSKSARTDDVCDAYFLAKFAWYKNLRQAVVKSETCRDRLRNRLELSMGGI